MSNAAWGIAVHKMFEKLFVYNTGVVQKCIRPRKNIRLRDFTVCIIRCVYRT